ncbi:sugar phosphate isomerase/epimerase family protein [Streptomyces sp. NPDC058382]|uniref:sugar phosphate isomerase/epimerase family protein n=1 Tax=unclassified Streptomyces TaxID=2593676 RepID=UPI003629D65E
MTLLTRTDLGFAYLQLTGSPWQEPVRYTIEERLAALAENNCVSMGMAVEELESFLSEHPADKLRGLLSEYGVGLHELEVNFGWNAEPAESGPALESETRLFELAELVGIPSVKSCAVYPPGVQMPPVEVLTERFAAMCDRAAARGLDISLEAMAVMPGFTYQVASDIIAAADRPNAGLLVDMWHLFRDPTGIGSIDQLTGAQIVGVEFSDAPSTPSPDVMNEVLSGRLLPGDGDFDISGLLHTLDAKGVDVTPAVEVLSAELRALPLSESIARAAAAVRASLAKARGESAS